MTSDSLRIILALDIGTQRTGVAIANTLIGIARPLVTLPPEELNSAVAKLVVEHNAAAIVIGLPRNLEGNDTQQTHYVRETAAQIGLAAGVPIHFMDEAATSIQAEAELKSRGKPYSKGDIDMLSAVYILEDFLKQELSRA